jgi:hypothetical protein
LNVSDVSPKKVRISHKIPPVARLVPVVHPIIARVPDGMDVTERWGNLEEETFFGGVKKGGNPTED